MVQHFGTPWWPAFRGCLELSTHSAQSSDDCSFCTNYLCFLARALDGVSSSNQTRVFIPLDKPTRAWEWEEPFQCLLCL